MKVSAPFVTGFGLGFCIALIACEPAPAVTVMRIGMGFVVLIAIAGFFLGVAGLIDLACRVFKLSREFIAFMWEREKKKKRSS